MALENLLLFLDGADPFIAVATLLTACFIVFAFLSLKTSIRSHTLKLSAIFAVLALALFSNNPWCYFASLFIIATAITEVEFLQNLAAIIRGNKDYFDYKKQLISSEDAIEKIGKEKLDQLVPPSSSTSLDNSESTSPKSVIRHKTAPKDVKKYAERLYKLEQTALDKLETIFGKDIQRNVQLNTKKNSFFFDGIIEEGTGNNVRLKIFEVKTTGYREAKDITRVLETVISRAAEFAIESGREPELQLVLISEGPEPLEENVKTKITRFVKRKGTGIGISIFTTEQLEIK